MTADRHPSSVGPQRAPSAAGRVGLPRLVRIGALMLGVLSVAVGLARDEAVVAVSGALLVPSVVLSRRLTPGGRTWLLFGLSLLATGGVESPLVILGAPLSFLWSVRIGDGGRSAATVAAVVIGFGSLIALQIGLHVDVPGGVMDLLGPWARAAVEVAIVAAACALAVATAGRLIEGAARSAGASARLNDAADETLDAHGDDMVGMLRSVADSLERPIADVVARADALRSAAPPQMATQIGVLADEASRLEALLADLGDFARPVADGDRAPVDLRAVAEQVAAAQAAAVEAKGLRVVFEGAATVEASSAKVVQLVVNLFQNAVAASPEGGTIAVRVATTDDGARVALVDEGPGIAPEVRARLFTPGATTRSAGSGMGLVVARALAEQHGGWVTLDDRTPGAGAGAVAVAWLPARPRLRPATDSGGAPVWAPLARLTWVGPRVGAAMSGAAAAALWVEGAAMASAVALAAIAAALAAFALRARSGPSLIGGVVLTVQAVTVAATGGLDSPILLVLPIGAVLSRLGVRGWALWVRWAALAAFLVTLGVLDVVAPTGGAVEHLGYWPTWLFFGVSWMGPTVVGWRGGALLPGALAAVAEARRAARRRLADAQSRRNAALLGLAGGVAHEVKNPLAAVLGLSALLAGRVPPGHPAGPELEALAAEARAMSRTLSRFLDFSRPLSPLTRTAESLADVVSDAIEAAAATADARGVRLVPSVDARPRVWADRRKLRQLLASALDDRITRAEPGADLRVTVAREPTAARVTLELSAATAAPETAPSAFVIARTLVEQHGGHLAERALDGSARRLELTLPLTPTEPAP